MTNGIKLDMFIYLKHLFQTNTRYLILVFKNRIYASCAFS